MKQVVFGILALIIGCGSDNKEVSVDNKMIYFQSRSNENGEVVFNGDAKFVLRDSETAKRLVGLEAFLVTNNSEAVILVIDSEGKYPAQIVNLNQQNEGQIVQGLGIKKQALLGLITDIYLTVGCKLNEECESELLTSERIPPFLSNYILETFFDFDRNTTLGELDYTIEDVLRGKSVSNVVSWLISLSEAASTILSYAESAINIEKLTWAAYYRTLCYEDNDEFEIYRPKEFIQTLLPGSYGLIVVLPKKAPTSWIQAKTFNITGKVIDKDTGQDIIGAEVVLMPIGEKRGTFYGSLGSGSNFGFLNQRACEDDIYWLTAAKPGYLRARSEDIQVFDGGDYNVVIEMSKAELEDCLPEEEICDGVDNNCDGRVDENNVCGESNSRCRNMRSLFDFGYNYDFSIKINERWAFVNSSSKDNHQQQTDHIEQINLETGETNEIELGEGWQPYISWDNEFDIDGDLAVFWITRYLPEGQEHSICIYNLAQKAVVKIIETITPWFSINNKRIAFPINENGDQNLEIGVYDVETDDITVIYLDTPGNDFDELSLSGNKLAYWRGTSGYMGRYAQDVFVIDLTTLENTNLTNRVFENDEPKYLVYKFKLDGSYLVFYEARFVGGVEEYRAYVMYNIENNQRTVLTEWADERKFLYRTFSALSLMNGVVVWAEPQFVFEGDDVYIKSDVVWSYNIMTREKYMVIDPAQLSFKDSEKLRIYELATNGQIVVWVGETLRVDGIYRSELLACDL